MIGWEKRWKSDSIREDHLVCHLRFDIRAGSCSGVGCDAVTNEPCSLRRDWSAFLKSGAGADVLLRCHSGERHVHKAVFDGTIASVP